jgi:hypothetical protein
MPVEEMLNRMSSREITEWRAFTSIEPVGEDRADLRHAMLCALLANANRDPDKQSSPFKVTDFMFDWWNEKPEQEDDWQSMKMVAKDLTGLQRGIYDHDNSTSRKAKSRRI